MARYAVNDTGQDISRVLTGHYLTDKPEPRRFCEHCGRYYWRKKAGHYCAEWFNSEYKVYAADNNKEKGE